MTEPKLIISYRKFNNRYCDSPRGSEGGDVVQRFIKHGGKDVFEALASKLHGMAIEAVVEQEFDRNSNMPTLSTFLEDFPTRSVIVRYAAPNNIRKYCVLVRPQGATGLTEDDLTELRLELVRAAKELGFVSSAVANTVTNNTEVTPSAMAAAVAAAGQVVSTAGQHRYKTTLEFAQAVADRLGKVTPQFVLSCLNSATARGMAVRKDTKYVPISLQEEIKPEEVEEQPQVAQAVLAPPVLSTTAATILSSIEQQRKRRNNLVAARSALIVAEKEFQSEFDKLVGAVAELTSDDVLTMAEIAALKKKAEK